MHILTRDALNACCIVFSFSRPLSRRKFSCSTAPVSSSVHTTQTNSDLKKSNTDQASLTKRIHRFFFTRHTTICPLKKHVLQYNHRTYKLTHTPPWYNEGVEPPIWIFVLLRHSDINFFDPPSWICHLGIFEELTETNEESQQNAYMQSTN